MSQNVVPVKGLTDISGSGLLIASSLIRAVKNVKIYRLQCEHLSRQCLDLASALRDHSDKLEGTGTQQAVDEVERVLTRILDRVRKWEDLGKMKSFVKQKEIRMGLDECHRELHACSLRFNIALHLDASSRSRELEEIRRHDHDELLEMITRALQDKSLLKMELATGTPEDAHNVVEVIEQELKEADVGETQERQLQEDFGELRRWVENLPPMVDLTGKIFRTSEHPIASGGSQDIYTGEWAGQEVSLAYPRKQSRAEKERFQRQVEIWRTLRHPNILQLLGIAYIGDFVYSVSPCMEFGHVIRFLTDNPDADRVFLLSEIASASEYLHMNGIIHGDLQGSNVLISGDGHACLGDMGSARVEEVPVTEAITYGSLRWLAPELVTESSHVPTTRATDVWSFGMLTLEIFTDNVPFSHILNEAYIPLAILNGSLPARPEQNVTMRGLNDAFWNLMNQCWQRDPKSRPSMSAVRETIQNIRPMLSRPSRSLSNSPPENMRKHGSSFSNVAGVSGGSLPSALTLSRSPRSSGLTPPTAPVSLPKTSACDEAEFELIQRSPSGTPASFPSRNAPILNIPLSSSPSFGLTSSPRSVPGKSIAIPQNRSPLSSSSHIPLPSTSTTLESRTSISLSNDHPDWSLKLPLLLSEPSISSQPELSLLLQPAIVTPPSKPGSVDEHKRTGSTSTGSFRSSSGGLLEAAAQDTEPLLRISPDGTVEAGTLEGLVDRLIKDTHDRTKDEEFRRVFLATYPLFTTGGDLFRRLKRRIGEVGDVKTPILSGLSRYSVLLVLRTWLQGESENWTGSRELLSSIRDFARSVDGSDTMKDAAEGIANLANEKMDVAIVSLISPPRPRPLRETTLQFSLEHYKPEDIAKSLSVIEGEFYSEITQADYIAHLRGTPVTTHIASATSNNNLLIDWVKGNILGSEDVNRRATNFKHFVLVAEECRKCHNFSSMSAIVDALQSIPQLILTREIKLTKSEKQLLPQMDEILAPQADNRAYREVLQNSNSPFAVPWLAGHLRSLQTLYDRHSSTVVVDQRPLINFTRCAKILERIDDIRQYRPSLSPSPQSAPSTPPPPLASLLLSKAKAKDKDRRRNSGMAPAPALSLAWVKEELDNTPSAISREQFETRAAALAEIERQMHESHGPELQSLGFGTAFLRRHRTFSSGSSVRLPGRGRMASPDLLALKRVDVPARVSVDQTELHEASEHGYLGILRSLLSSGTNPNAHEGKVAPLFLASGGGRLEAARLLCDHGANVNHQDPLGRTSLHVAAENGHYGIGNLLLECSAEVDAHDKMEWTALHFASQQGHLELVRLLLEHGADALARNQEGHTFLDVAWASGHREIVDVNTRYEDGLTALHIASQHGDPELMCWLIDRNVSPSAEDGAKETPLFTASRNGKLEAARLLLDAGADPNHRDTQGMTPLHVASENGHEFVAKLLLEHNADVTAKHVYDWTPLHLASRTGESKVAELLLDHHAEVNAMNDSNWTPLHMASQKGHSNVVELLLAYHADVNAQEADGETALHLAVFYGHRVVVQVLLNNGADPRIKNKEGETPFDVASSRESKDIVQLLEL